MIYLTDVLVYLVRVYNSTSYKFDVRGSVHPRTIFVYKINQQDATVFQVYYSTFICGSTCFRRHTAHHQEHTTALAASGFVYIAG
jgi:hypothetical protein